MGGGIGWIVPRGAVLAVFVALAACAPGTTAHDTHVQMAVTTEPPGAACVFMRENRQIGELAVTPGEVQLPSGREPIVITCSKPGHVTASYVNTTPNRPRPSATNLGYRGGRLLAAGLIELAIAGSNDGYDRTVRLTLRPAAAGAASGEAEPRASSQITGKLPRTGN
jgi:hypothetical protein